MPGQFFRKIMIDSMEIIGYSVAGEESFVAIPSLDVCFDVGRAPDEAVSANHVLLSHGHMDHAAGVAYYCSQRDFREMAPGTVLLPDNLAPAVEELLNVWGQIDGNRPPANIIPMYPGQEYELRRNLFAYPFETNHSWKALGYTIIERRNKLKEEYLGLPGPEIVKLKNSGIPITYTINMPLVTYLGDTTSGDFENLACVQDSKILITECTFFEQDQHERARAGKHYHIDHLGKMLEKWNNEHIILTHLSRRTDMKIAKKMIKDTFSPELAKKVRFLMDRPRRSPA
ncbi:MAG: MBL fold metallo-hydrolase [Phycisphaerae bacterium]|nr:MBL fold metallo-hydrolase [Phycisphaerae bacterium]